MSGRSPNGPEQEIEPVILSQIRRRGPTRGQLKETMAPFGAGTTRVPISSEWAGVFGWPEPAKKMGYRNAIFRSDCTGEKIIRGVGFEPRPGADRSRLRRTHPIALAGRDQRVPKVSKRPSHLVEWRNKMSGGLARIGYALIVVPLTGVSLAKPPEYHFSLNPALKLRTAASHVESSSP